MIQTLKRRWPYAVVKRSMCVVSITCTTGRKRSNMRGQVTASFDSEMSICVRATLGSACGRSIQERLKMIEKVLG